MSSSSSSYSLREIVPEREPIPVSDLSDDESVEGPEMAPVAPRIGLGISIEEDPSEPTSDSEMTPEPERVAPAVTGDMGIFVANSLPVAASPTPILPMENMSGSQSSNHADEAVSESSQNRQSEPIREATPCPEQATHKLLNYEEWQRIGGLELLKLGPSRTNHGPNDFQEEFKKEYIPRWVREQREDEFQQLRQGNLTVAQYTA
ncbi:hypothetical protein M9H77_16416 [Catharanthus roseus]|uniref:Uncharacterized protein n=1 Tax=Catharanthus roseus TaxID=4058 RepID=A0ACC0B204_CATRO|nr:hypothetical protein M9H77_16416 [Catharanthus roseus]